MDIMLTPGGIMLVCRDKKEPHLSGRPFSSGEICDVQLDVEELEQIIQTLNEKRYGFIEGIIWKWTLTKYCQSGKTPVTDAIEEQK